MHRELTKLHSKGSSKNRSNFPLFQSHSYISAIGMFPTGEIPILEMHPINLDRHNNVNVIIIKSSSPSKTWQWTL